MSITAWSHTFVPSTRRTLDVSICQISSGLLARTPTVGLCGCSRPLGRLQPCARTSLRHVDGEAKTVLRRSVGTQVLTGCRGPDTVNLAVREPGNYTLRVRFAGGTVKEEKIAVGGNKHVSLTVTGD